MFLSYVQKDVVKFDFKNYFEKSGFQYKYMYRGTDVFPGTDTCIVGTECCKLDIQYQIGSNVLTIT
jgi:hypothetical protein